MLKYLETTTLILFWCLALSVAWCHLVYAFVQRVPRLEKVLKSRRNSLMPALVVGPLTLIIFYKAFEWNLLFPVHVFAGTAELARAALVPAVILLTASGLFSNMARQITAEYVYWRGKPFARTLAAIGQPVPRALRRLVLLKSFAASWGQSLPWLFGELIVVECVFNAPGLGLAAWRQARQRDMTGLAENIFCLVVLYGGFVLISELIARWLGKRLATYN